MSPAAHSKVMKNASVQNHSYSTVPFPVIPTGAKRSGGIAVADLSWDVFRQSLCKMRSAVPKLFPPASREPCNDFRYKLEMTA